MPRLLLCAGQVQLMQVKPDQGQLQHPAALETFGHRHSLTSGARRGSRGTNVMGMPGMFKSVIAGDCLTKEEKEES